MQHSYTLYDGKGEFICDQDTSWHAHFYSKPPVRPTPHFVEDILGLKSPRQGALEDMMVDEQITDPRNRHVIVEMSCIRKPKQKSKCKSKIKYPIAVNDRDSVRGKVKSTPSSPKTTTAKKEPDPSKTETNNESVKRKKKARTTFTGRQIWELENTFKDKKYLTAGERNELAQLLNVTDNQVKIWFQNRRTKWKKHVSNGARESSPAKSENNNEEDYKKVNKTNKRVVEEEEGRATPVGNAHENRNESGSASEDEND